MQTSSVDGGHAPDGNAAEERILGLLRKVDLEVGSLLRSRAQHRDLVEDVTGKLRKLGDGIAMIGSDPGRNIDVIVETVAAIIGAPCSLYNRLDAERSVLSTWSIHNPPPDYVREDPATGHICFETTMKTDHVPIILEELRGTEWEERDSVVKKHGLRAYLGFPVRHRGAVVGSLCVVDAEPRHFSATDVLIVTTLAKAMSIEEERKATESELEERLRTIERQEEALRRLAGAKA